MPEETQNYNKMKTNTVKISLNLNEKWRIFLRNELRTFALEHPDCKFEIICWVDDNVIITAREIDHYLAENECLSRLKTGGKIIGKSRTVFFDLTKKEIL